MKNAKILYIVITIFCIFAISYGVYDQFFNPNKKENKTVTTTTSVANVQNTVQEQGPIDTAEDLKKQFNSMFDNKINLNGFNSSQVAKINPNEEIVYTVQSIKQEREDKYEININIPGLNIQSNVINEFNKTTQSMFVDKAEEIIQKVSSGSDSAESQDVIEEDPTVYGRTRKRAS